MDAIAQGDELVTRQVIDVDISGHGVRVR